MKLIALRGLPGSGKSLLAHALAPRMGAVVLDKDVVRMALFPGDTVEYLTAQDDVVIDAMLLAAAWHLRYRHVLLDGRVFARRKQVEHVRTFALAQGHEFHLVECWCPVEVARRRVAADVSHPARNRTEDLVDRQAAQWEALEGPVIAVDTTQALERAVADALEQLTR
jgi:predicted kinase